MKALLVLLLVLSASTAFSRDITLPVRTVLDKSKMLASCQSPQAYGEIYFLPREANLENLGNGMLRISFHKPFLLCTSSGWVPLADASPSDMALALRLSSDPKGIDASAIAFNTPNAGIFESRISQPDLSNVAIDVRSVDLVGEKEELLVQQKDGAAIVNLGFYWRKKVRASAAANDWMILSGPLYLLQIPIAVLVD